MFIPNPNFIADLMGNTADIVAEQAQVAADEANKLRHRVMPRKRNNAVVVEKQAPDVFIVNTDLGGHLDEWGSKNNPAYAPLRTGVRNAGFDLIE
jgi:hypothetical protein